MTLKGWMLRRVNAMGNRDAREDSSRTPSRQGGAEEREPTFADHRTLAQSAEHLGPYGPLIAAIREELEHFVTEQVRLHLAIAERDRYVLTSIEVDCDGSEAQRELLRHFVGEFKPEQIKQFLAREVIAGLRNAAAIDLTQFAGLNAEQKKEDREDYDELISELQRGEKGSARPYQVMLVGRWAEQGARQPTESGTRPAGQQTPLAGRAIAIEIEDAAGVRRVEADSVVPGRRYAVGKGEGCDIPVDGVYVSRRHCEIWLERGTLWVADSGSTNGIRVEAASGAVTRSDAQTFASGRAIEFPPGARLVLSAHVRGDAQQYPRLVWHPVDVSAAMSTAGAKPAAGAVPSTPATPIASPPRRAGALTISATMASGSRSVEIVPGALPFQVGRSRNQALVVDWAHADVSGHHLDVVAIDESGASVVVHGDNGVSVDGVTHAAGARFLWKPGETLTLGRGAGPAPACALTLSRAP